ncbi:hypothetical protein GX888_03450 [Candidatus Dojkabacteria bacterium]|uniref:Uncharacterized protein n=1 Tax=Candidatus Dojkabacteria bacterium TaxID=2099670 RepID=A0A847VE26_9BACT|nr:hypothetical protein [Candidatus Dojkabacteria bacterium]
MTLTEAAFWTKKFGLIAVGIFAFGIIFLLIILKPKKTDLPQKYLEPDFACTQTPEEFLPDRLSIPSLEIVNNDNVEYVIQTDTGKLGDLPTIVNVYSYTDLEQKITAQAEAKILAGKLGFDPEMIIRRGTTEYLWNNNRTQRTLHVNARDLNFTFKTSINMIKELRKMSDLPTENEAITAATSILRSLGVLDEGYTTMQPSVYLITINPDDTYSEADSLLNAHLIRVDFQKQIPLISIPSNVEGAQKIISYLTKKNMSHTMGKILVNDSNVDVYNFSTLMTYSNPSKSNVSVYVGAENPSIKNHNSIHQIEFRTWQQEVESCGTYPLISPEIAQNRVQNGEGSLVQLNYNNDEIAPYISQDVKRYIITDLYITYYEGLYEQKFLQPVYLFTGVATLADNSSADFFIYYPAIDYDNLEERKELPELPTTKKKDSILPF